MKKFCSSCGSQLELSKRTCTECGAANPFFIANFTLLEDQSDELEKLRLEKEKIEKELSEKQAAQVEFQRQEQLKKELEELEKQKKETLEKERQIREALEQTPETGLKKELEQVKKETEQYKRETLDLLQQIREELKEKAEALEQKAKVEIQKPRVEAVPVPERIETKKTAPVDEYSQKPVSMTMVATIIILLIVGISAPIAYFKFKPATPPQTEKAANTETETPSETTTPVDEPVKTEPEYTSTTTDTVGTANSLPVNSNILAEASGKPTPPTTTKSSTPFELTADRAMNDLIGRKLSGCNIVVHSVSEVSNLSYPVLIEKLSSGYLKYKFNVKITQNNDIYSSSPYVYYTSNGRFLKIDGTNCE